MGRLFGTDGVRGLANEKLNCELVYKLGQASARVLSLAQYKPEYWLEGIPGYREICWRRL